MEPSASREAPSPRLRKTFISCALFLLLDIGVLGSPVLGVYVGLVLVIWFLPRIVFSWRSRERRRHRAMVAVVIVAALVLDCAAFVVQERMARQRLTSVADALTRYKARHGVYPSELELLVPDFLPAIPSAKPLLVQGAIMYLHRDEKAALMYVSFGFYIPILDVTTRRWSAID